LVAGRVFLAVVALRYRDGRAPAEIAGGCSDPRVTHSISPSYREVSMSLRPSLAVTCALVLAAAKLIADRLLAAM